MGCRLLKGGQCLRSTGIEKDATTGCGNIDFMAFFDYDLNIVSFDGNFRAKGVKTFGHIILCQ